MEKKGFSNSRLMKARQVLNFFVGLVFPQKGNRVRTGKGASMVGLVLIVIGIVSIIWSDVFASMRASFIKDTFGIKLKERPIKIIIIFIGGIFIVFGILLLIFWFF
jgi:small-conductance mechanosensitive channel